MSAESRRGKALQNTPVALLVTVCRCRAKRCFESSTRTKDRKAEAQGTRHKDVLHLNKVREGGTVFEKQSNFSFVIILSEFTRSEIFAYVAQFFLIVR